MRSVFPLLLVAGIVVTACSSSADPSGSSMDGGGASNDAGSSDAGSQQATDAGTPTDGGGGSDAGPTRGLCPEGATLCQNFDHGLDDWELPDTPEHATIQIDTTRAYSGHASLHVKTENGINEEDEGNPSAKAHIHKQTRDFDQRRFARAYYYLKGLPSQFGMMGTLFVQFSDHDEAWGGIELQIMQNSGFALDDWSGIDGTGWNLEDPVEVGLAAGRWVCVEWGVTRNDVDSDLGHAQVWVDGVLAYDFPGVGIRPFNNFYVGYGFVHPKGESASETWIDDLVVSDQRVGCE